MACGSCSRKKPPVRSKGVIYDVMGGYKYLPDNQIKARLEVFKKRHCPECATRYDCDFTIYTNCVKKLK